MPIPRARTLCASAAVIAFSAGAASADIA